MNLYKRRAINIICEYTEANMSSTQVNTNNDRELYDHMIEGCSYIITDMLVDGRLTPMEYNNLRNELGDMIWAIFKDSLKDDMGLVE